MKRLTALTVCVLAAATVFAQNAAPKKMTAAQKYAAAHKNAVTGYIRDARYMAVADAQVFVYKTDSSGAIISSGFTDATGHYETNFTPAGKYNIKIVYPSAKALTVQGVVKKNGLLDFSLKFAPPENDTTLPYTTFVPAPVEKKKGKK